MKHVFTSIIIPVVAYTVITMPVYAKMSNITYYYSFNKLTQADAPRKLDVIRVTSPQSGTTKLQKGILFSYKNRKTNNVFIAGNFSSWKKIPMQKGNHGVWYYFLASKPGPSSIQYKYCVDGIWLIDPQNSHTRDDNNGSFISLVTPEQKSTNRFMTYKIIQDNTVEFRYYAPQADYIAIVGDFNNWNPENDLLLKGADNIWRLKKTLPKGRYRYKYVIDGKWVADVFNEQSASDEVGGIASILTIQ